MSYGTSDSTVISPITTEAHNLDAIDASTAPNMDDVLTAKLPGNYVENLP